MNVCDIKYTRRYNIGQYEFEEYTVSATLEEGESIPESIAILKKEVAAAHAGEPCTGDDCEDENPTPDHGKKKKKRGRKPKKEEPDPEEDTEEDTEEEDEGEEETDGEEDADEDSGEEESDESEEGEEEEGTEEEGEGEEEPPKKKVGKKAGKKSSKKTFRKKPQVYARGNETHKNILSKALHKLVPDWNKSPKLRTMAKKASMKLDGKEFLDENGKVTEEFMSLLKRAMCGKKK